jgi:hypothetical protein
MLVQTRCKSRADQGKVPKNGESREKQRCLDYAALRSKMIQHRTAVLSFNRGDDHVCTYDCDPSYGLSMDTIEGPAD